jgi:hypothetical protein
LDFLGGIFTLLQLSCNFGAVGSWLDPAVSSSNVLHAPLLPQISAISRKLNNIFRIAQSERQSQHSTESGVLSLSIASIAVLSKGSPQWPLARVTNGVANS